MTYGYDIQPENDVYVRLADEAMQGLTHAIHPGAFLVDFLPIRMHAHFAICAVLDY